MRLRLLACTILAFVPASAASAATVSSTFDTSDEGWRWTDCIELRTPSWTAAGGNPGGRIRVFDDANFSDSCQEGVFAPAAFTGDMRSYYGGTFKIDVKHEPATAHETPVQIGGAGGSIVRDATAPTASWTTATFPLTETGWSYFKEDDGSDIHPATRAEFFAALRQASYLAMSADYDRGVGETTDFDNAILSQPATPLDTDGDGVTNASDNCPAVSGPSSNGGCPPPPPSPDPGPGGGNNPGGGGNPGGGPGSPAPGGGGNPGGSSTNPTVIPPPGISAPGSLTATASRKGVFKLARTTVACPAGGPACSLVAKITVSRKSSTLPRQTIGAGQSKAVQLKLTKALLKKLKKAKKLKASIALTATGGSSATKTMRVTLKAPKR